MHRSRTLLGTIFSISPLLTFFFVDIFRTNLAEREPENIITTTNVQTMRKIIGIIKKSITPSYHLEHSLTTVLKGC